MKPRVTAIIVVAICTSRCVARSRINPNCEWTNDTPSQLNMLRSVDVQHLLNDATIAEELAIRYADVTRGHRSGHFAGMDEYGAAREQCFASLAATVATTHGVDPQQVRDLRGQRPSGVDVFVGVSFALLYACVSAATAGTLMRRFPVDEPTPALIASLLVATVLSAFGVVALGLWASVVEMVRIGNDHMSYRADRLTWTH